jgi:hypothetical protein
MNYLPCIAYMAGAMATVAGTTPHAMGQTLPADSLQRYPSISRYYDGCMCILRAEQMAADDAQRNATYAEAMELLNTRTTSRRPGLKQGDMVLTLDDSTSVLEPQQIAFAFDYKYAKSCYQQIAFNPSGVTRGGYGADCRTFRVVVKPHGTVTCHERLHGDCLLLGLSYPDAALSLSVVDGDTIQAIPYEQGGVQYIHWQSLAESHPVTYIIQNLSDRTNVVTLVGN